MKISTGGQPILVRMPITGGGSNINDGALIAPGLTGDLGRVTISPAGGADAIGTLQGAHVTADDSLLNGTVWTFADIEISDKVSMVEIAYDLTDDIDVASTATTTVTITSLENNIDNGWLFATSGTGAGLLAFLVASASGSATSLTATGWDSTTDVIKILPIGHPLALLTATRDDLGSQAAVGTWTIFVVENYFEDDSHAKTLLDPTIHVNLTSTNAKFTSKVLIRNTAGHTID